MRRNLNLPNFRDLQVEAVCLFVSSLYRQQKLLDFRPVPVTQTAGRDASLSRHVEMYTSLYNYHKTKEFFFLPGSTKSTVNL